MNDWYVAGTVGGVLVVLGLGMMRAHYLSWQKQKRDNSGDNLGSGHDSVRFQRRMQTAGLMVLLGILIPIGDSPLIWGQGALVSTCYWMAVLCIPIWMVLLALGDLTATRARGKVELARLQRKQRELESQLTQMKSRRSNGKQHSE